MYFVFDSRVISAETLAETPSPERWYSCEPFEFDVPLIWTFSVLKRASREDFIGSGSWFDLFSPRLISILADQGARLETFPASFVDRHAKKGIELTHQVVHVLDCFDGVDRDRSVPDFDPKIPELLFYKRMVLTEECLVAQPQFFRDNSIKAMLVHDDLRKKLIASKLTNLRFTPVEYWGSKDPVPDLWS